VNYARAAIADEEVRGASAMALLNAADGDDPQAPMAVALAPALNKRFVVNATYLHSARAISSKSGRREAN
jgi:hypothetical protein